MDDCCQDKEQELVKLREKHSTLLKIILVINLVMFVIESYSGWIAKSTALFADSLDMLGDAFVYGMSLYALGRTPRWGVKLSLTKGFFMMGFGIWVLAQAVYRFLSPVLPEAEIMGSIGGLALIANIVCVLLLLKHRSDDINMRSTWLCSRNDVIANIGVLIAAALVALTNTRYPDLIIGAVVSSLVLHSAYVVLKESIQQLKST